MSHASDFEPYWLNDEEKDQIERQSRFIEGCFKVLLHVVLIVVVAQWIAAKLEVM
jgi:hypothetical protein